MVAVKIEKNRAYIIFDVSEIRGKRRDEVINKAVRAAKALYIKINGGCGCI